MYLDIGICVFLLLSVALGWYKGFMCGIVSFVSGLVSFMVAIFTASPVAGLMNRWFGLSAEFDKILDGKGQFINVLICGIVVYLVCRLVFFFIARFIRKIKDRSKVIDKVDKIAGLFLGAAKGFVSIAGIFVMLYLLTSVPFVNSAVDWLLQNSAVGKFFYEASIKYVVPLLGNLTASGII
jgi:uncharacterized membrane protein required for colicin V production